VAPVSATTSRRPSTNASGEMAQCSANTSPGGRVISSGEWSTSDRDKGSDSRDTREQVGEDEIRDGREGPTGDSGYTETDPLGLKSAPSSSPSQQKLSVELSSPASTVAVSPAGADGEPEAETGRGTTAAGAAVGGVAVGGPAQRSCPLFFVLAATSFF
jgi:hypothetical protein